MEEVASSRISMGGRHNISLVIHKSCFCQVNRKGGIVVNEAGLTSHQNVYAGGDAVTGAATVILAMGAGKLGAKSIDEALSK